MSTLNFAALIQSLIIIKTQIKCPGLSSIQIQVRWFQISVWNTLLIICHFSRDQKVYFPAFLLYYSIPKLETYFHREQDLFSSDSYLEVRINGVKGSQSSSELGVASKNLCYGRTHRKAVPSLLHFLFIIGPLGSEIR